MTHQGMPRRTLIALTAAIATLAVVAIVVGTGLARGGSTRPAETTTTTTAPSAFDPGSIISDYNFFNPNAMTEADIQSFLEHRDCVAQPDAPCLWEYREDTTAEPAQGDGHCAAYRPAADERASRIIAKVATACTISPRVLLVLLQKEQSLLTRPTASGYLRATGYGCPDTADCDTEYFGFFNQVYRAAWQFRQYTQEPERAYKVGIVDVGYNPDTSCGATPVRIENQATANLYNYTPYQPNRAALANPGSDGDGCSTHGNLNFWLFYNDWFGPSRQDGYPALFGSCLNLVGGQPCPEQEFLPH